MAQRLARAKTAKKTPGEKGTPVIDLSAPASPGATSSSPSGSTKKRAASFDRPPPAPKRGSCSFVPAWSCTPHQSVISSPSVAQEWLLKGVLPLDSDASKASLHETFVAEACHAQAIATVYQREAILRTSQLIKELEDKDARIEELEKGREKLVADKDSAMAVLRKVRLQYVERETELQIARERLEEAKQELETVKKQAAAKEEEHSEIIADCYGEGWNGCLDKLRALHPDMDTSALIEPSELAMIEAQRLEEAEKAKDAMLEDADQSKEGEELGVTEEIMDLCQDPPAIELPPSVPSDSTSIVPYNPASVVAPDSSANDDVLPPPA